MAKKLDDVNRYRKHTGLTVDPVVLDATSKVCVLIAMHSTRELKRMEPHTLNGGWYAGDHKDNKLKTCLAQDVVLYEMYKHTKKD